MINHRNINHNSMKKLIILTDEDSDFLISRSNTKDFTTMDVEKIRVNFVQKGYSVIVTRFSKLDLNQDFKDINIIYQTSEAPGAFYKRYIEDLIYLLGKRGANAIPAFEYLKAHHNKVFMEFLRSTFNDNALKSIKAVCYGSWVDAQNYNSDFPVVIKKCSSAGSLGVHLACNRKEYDKLIRKMGKIIVAGNIQDVFLNYFKRLYRLTVKRFYPEKSHYVQYNTAPVSTALIIQTFIEGLTGDFRVLILGRKYYFMFRGNRVNDFRASGSGIVADVPEKLHEDLLNFSRKITMEVDSPIIALDVGHDGKQFHLIEFQMIHMGTSALHRSGFWYEFHEGNWVKFEGKSDLEEEYSRAIDEYIQYRKNDTIIEKSLTEPAKK